MAFTWDFKVVGLGFRVLGLGFGFGFMVQASQD